jgi:hypothetical protein
MCSPVPKAAIPTHFWYACKGRGRGWRSSHAETSLVCLAGPQLHGCAEELDAYCLKHFPAGLLQFTNSRLSAQLTAEALSLASTPK